MASSFRACLSDAAFSGFSFFFRLLDVSFNTFWALSKMGSNREPLSEDEESRRSRSVPPCGVFSLWWRCFVCARTVLFVVVVVTARQCWFLYVKNTVCVCILHIKGAPSRSEEGEIRETKLGKDQTRSNRYITYFYIS